MRGTKPEVTFLLEGSVLHQFSDSGCRRPDPLESCEVQLLPEELMAEQQAASALGTPHSLCSMAFLA